MRPVVSEPNIFTTLARDTVAALNHAYNRMTTSNEQMAFLSDLNHGPTAVLVAVTAAPSMTDPRVKETYERFLNHRDDVRTGVMERLRDLKPHLDNAIEAVEAELGIAGKPPVAQRAYRPETPVGFMGDPKTLPPAPPRAC
jgi:hypothetical protein